MAGANIIREYLVSLGFKLDDNSLKKFDSALVKTAKNTFGFAASIVAVAVATTVAVDKIAKKFDDLYWVSVRTKAGAANIQDFQLALSKVGGTAQGAVAALENVARYMRTNPAAEGFMRNLGIKTRDANGELRDSIDIVKQLAALPLPYWLKVNFAEKFGVDENTLQAIIRAAPEAQNKLSNLYKALGIDADEAAEKSKDFENSLKDLDGELGVVSWLLGRTLLPFAKGFVAILETAVYWVAKLDAVTDGWASTLLYIGVVAGGIALVFGWLPAVLMLLALSAAAVVGNWDKVKAYFNSFVGWLRDKYNTVAKYLGLPQWGGSTKPANDNERQKRGLSGADYKKDERNLGPNSMYGSGNVTGKALEFFKKAGWSADAAAGIVANLISENGRFDPRKTGDSGSAKGIAQWHPDRQADFEKWSGKKFDESTVEDQMAFVDHELRKGTRQLAGRLLAGAKSAAHAGMIVSKYYEAPKDEQGEMAKRGRLADQLSKTDLSSGAGHKGNVTINQKTDIKVSGSDPVSTGRAVERGQSRVNGDLVRNMSSAVS